MNNSCMKGKSRVIDSPDNTEIYANMIVGTSFDGSAIIVSLGTTRITPGRFGEPITAPPDVYVTGRIALSLKAALELSKSIQQLLEAASNMNTSSMIKTSATVALNGRQAEAGKAAAMEPVTSKKLS
jgi:hypothetical protein